MTSKFYELERLREMVKYYSDQRAGLNSMVKPKSASLREISIY